MTIWWIIFDEMLHSFLHYLCVAHPNP